MASGVKVSKDCLEAFDKLKMKKEYVYVVYKLNDAMKEIIVDQCGERSEENDGYADLRQILLDAAEKKECRYAVYDLKFDFKGSSKQKLIFISWSPEGANIKQKMVYTSSKDYIKKALQLVVEAQACDVEEISMESLTEKASRGMKD